MDTGQTDAALHNLGLLGVTPGQLEGFVISHGHYDHTGGLAAMLAQAGKTLPVYMAPNIFMRRYSRSGGVQRYIGVPHAREMLESTGADFCLVDQPRQLAEDLWISGPVPRQTAFETPDTGFVDETSAEDIVIDDMSLFYAGAKGLTVITGCAHSGLINIIQHGLAVTGSKRLHGIVGGTHLGPASPERQAATLDALASFEPDFVAANHCTGFAMMARLQAMFGEKFVPAFVGTVLEL
jgi:7,8-dihydropterin-6-yl-methyl-4-(beta-D-ribofuranosyl)aminobenzene 5'-phosphate synthase